MHFHWQNLNEKKKAHRNDPERTGLPYHGRCWWHFGKGSRKTIGFSWNLWTHFCHAEFEIRDGWMFSIAFPPVAFWLHFEGFKILRKLSPKRLSKYLKEPTWLTDEGECKIAIHNWTLWVTPWGKWGEWNSRDPWWVRGWTLHFDDLILGRQKYTKEELEQFEILIPMPEANYPALVTVERCRWKRPRWFKTERVDARVDIKTKGGIPFPGKGENSWDCGTDGLCGYGCSSLKPEDIIAEGVQSVLNSRRRYGGSVEWLPESREQVA